MGGVWNQQAFLVISMCDKHKHFKLMGIMGKENGTFGMVCQEQLCFHYLGKYALSYAPK